MIQTKQQMSDSFLIGILLAVVGGFLDAYTFVARGGVFANAQTGNMVLFGLNLVEGRWTLAYSYFLPILAFVCGVFIDEWIRKYFMEKRRIHWRQIILLFEALILLGVAFLPLGGKKDLLANILVSFVCSMQVQSFRKVRGLPYATTMCTGNLRSGTELLFRFSQTKDRKDWVKSLHYYGIIFFFILGAGIGALCTNRFGSFATVFCCILLLVTCGLLFIRSEE